MISSVVPKGTIVTGYVKKSYGKFLHSVIELEEEKGTYIIDYTKNLFMGKGQYYKLTNFEEIERISEQQFIEDLLQIEQFPISVKAYLTFRSEIIRDLEKNKFLFTENKELIKEIESIKQERKELLEDREKDEER